MLNERLRRGGSKRRLGLEAPNYLVVGIRERAGGDDTDAVASGPDRRPDPGGPGTPTLRALILSRNSALEWYAPARGSPGSGRQCRPQNGRSLRSF